MWSISHHTSRTEPSHGTLRKATGEYSVSATATGKTNHPASPEATGLEVDKLDPKAITEYFHNYLQTYADASGGKLGKGGIEYLLTDSYEAGAQT